MQEAGIKFQPQTARMTPILILLHQEEIKICVIRVICG